MEDGDSACHHNISINIQEIRESERERGRERERERERERNGFGGPGIGDAALEWGGADRGNVPLG